MKEILTYSDDEGTYTRELEILDGCDSCMGSGNCRVDGELMSMDRPCPLVCSNLISRAPKGNYEARFTSANTAITP